MTRKHEGQRILWLLQSRDPHDENLDAWLPKESVRDVYLTDDVAEATLLLEKAIAGCLDDEVPEIVTLGRTLERWRTRSSTTTAPAPPTDRRRGRTSA